MNKNSSSNRNFSALALFFCLAFILSTASSALAGAVRPGFNTSSLAANADGSTGNIPLGFSVDYFGTTYNSAYVNNNGNTRFSYKK